MFKNILIILLLAFSTNLLSQSDETQIKKAEELNLNGDNKGAEEILLNIPRSSGSFIDARILLGKIYGLESRYTEARNVLYQVIRIDNDNVAAYSELINIEMKTENYIDAAKFAEFAISNEPLNEELFIRRAAALEKLNRTDEAGYALSKALNIYPLNPEVLKQLDLVEEAGFANKLFVNYRTDIFEDKEPWHFVNIGYTRLFGFGSLSFKVNNASRLDEFGLQFEAEGLAGITRSTAVYLDAGYSKDEIFPKIRSSIEIYQRISDVLSASIGGGLVTFKSADENLKIATGSLSYTLSSWLFLARPFFTLKNEEATISGIIKITYYFADPTHSLTLLGGYGFVPYEKYTALDYVRNKSERVSLYYNLRASKLLEISTGVTYENEEYRASAFNQGFVNSTRNRFKVEAGLKTFF